MESSSSQPLLHQHGLEIQQFGTVRQLPLALSHDACLHSSQRLNKILADTQILYALYKKHHWLMRGPTFYQLHLLLDKHAEELVGKKVIVAITGARPHQARVSLAPDRRGSCTINHR
jgi:hypothetical protein